MAETKEYDVALSYAGEQRAYVRRVAEQLEAEGVSVFFDDFERMDLWGHDLAVHFDTIYRTGARFVVPFISREYAAKAWPQHEFKSALAQAVGAKEPYILPVRFDDTELPGLRPTIKYLDGKRLAPEEVAEAILIRLGKTETGQPRAAARPSRLPKLPPPDFNPYAEAERAVAHLRQELTRRAKELEERGFGVHAQVRNERFMLRVMQSGRTIYSLDIWIGGGWGDDAICFSFGAGGGTSSNSTNAQGLIEWDKQQGGPIVKLMNFSLLPTTGEDYRLTPEELADAIWEELCRRVEQAAK